MTKKLLAGAVCAAGVTAGTVLAVWAGQGNASGPSAPGALILQLAFDPSASHTTDVAPKGPSAGDMYIYSATIKRDGKVVGRLEGTTVAADNTYQGDVSTQYLALSDGTVAIVGGGQSGAPGVGRPDDQIDDSIVGGSGRYAGAGGWVTVKDLGRNVEQMTLHFTS
jgi:hypothetical protein